MPLVEFQKVVSIQSFRGGEPTIFPAVWPGSEVDTWLLSQCELYAAQLATPKDLDEFYSRTLESVESLCKRIGTPVGMRRFELSQEVIDRLDNGTFPRDGPRGWARLLESGFYGQKLAPLAPGAKWEPFRNWRELIDVFGCVIYAAQSISSNI